MVKEVKQIKIFDEYEIKARYIPSILASLPLIMLSSIPKEETYISLFRTAEYFLVIENISFSLIVIILLIHFQRFIGKYLLESLVFKDEMKFPTTEMLLWKDNRLSRSNKCKIHKKVKQDFDILLFDEEQERENTVEASKIAKETVAHIRSKVGRGRLTFQHNIQYGFARNCIAGSIISLPFALLSIYVFSFVKVVYTGVIIMSLYSVFCIFLLIFYKQIMNKLANNYAQVLIIEYLVFEKESKAIRK